MTKLSLLGATALVAFAALTAPTFAKQKAGPALNAYAQTGSCAGHEAGNPFDRDTDYQGWSAWRESGSFDPRNDMKCNPSVEAR